MEPEIASLVSPTHLAEIARLWQGVSPAAPLDDVTNLVYRFQCQDKPRILRLSHSSHRTETQILAELHWIDYLVRGGVGVAQAVLSQNDRWEEVIEVPGSYFTATVFEQAAGNPLDRSHLDFHAPTFYRNWGRTIGRMHALTKRYDPGPHRGNRPTWDENNPDLFRARQIVPPQEEKVILEAERILSWLKSLSRDANSFGLVHDDLNATNFFVDHNHVTVFDFDDCCYDWFATDLATAIPYFSPFYAGEESPSRIREFLLPLFSGYREENELAENWLEQLPAFFRMHNLSGLLFSYTIDRQNREEYTDYFDLLWEVWQEGCPFFDFDFAEVYRQASPDDEARQGS
jgi:Ser/Thr protein kinase RdoA (MazF antagonist)